MIKLNKKVKYCLKNLSDEQLRIFSEKLIEEGFVYDRLIWKSDLSDDMSDIRYNTKYTRWEWCIISDKSIDALTLFEPIEDWTPKQGDKVLLRVVDKWIPKIFVCNHNGKNLFETAQGNAVFFEGEIKPFIKFFKKGDWVKYKNNGETFFTQCKEDVENNNLTLVEDLELIKLMEKNKSLA